MHKSPFSFNYDYGSITIEATYWYKSHLIGIPGVHGTKDYQYLNTLDQQYQTLIKIRLKYFSAWRTLKRICKIMLDRYGFCDVYVTKIFVIMISTHHELESFLSEFPDYNILCANGDFSPELFENLYGSTIYEYGTTQIRNGTDIFRCYPIRVFGCLSLIGKRGNSLTLFDEKGRLLAEGKTLTELLYYTFTKDKNALHL